LGEGGHQIIFATHEIEENGAKQYVQTVAAEIYDGVLWIHEHKKKLVVLENDCRNVFHR
jgi:hypothetical protein